MEPARRVIISTLPKSVIWSGALVKKKREELGISKANLAKALNTSPQNIHNWEAKNVLINSVHWPKLEKAFAAKDVAVVASDALPGIEAKDLVPVPAPKPTMANKDPDVISLMRDLHSRCTTEPSTTTSVTACDLLREIKAVAAMLCTGGMEQERIDRLLSWREDDAPLLQIALDKYVSAFKKAHEMTEMFLMWFNEEDNKRTEMARSVVREIDATEKANSIEKSANAQLATQGSPSRRTYLSLDDKARCRCGSNLPPFLCPCCGANDTVGCKQCCSGTCTTCGEIGDKKYGSHTS